MSPSSNRERGIFSVSRKTRQCYRTDCNCQRGRKERKQGNAGKAHLITVFPCKNHIPHTTTFEVIDLKGHRETCSRKATYESYSTIVELLASISMTLENSLLNSFKGRVCYLIMADESTDVASKEELSVSARWLPQNMTVEYFLGVIQAKETNAETITGYIPDFLQSRGIRLEKMHVEKSVAFDFLKISNVTDKCPLFIPS